MKFRTAIYERKGFGVLLVWSALLAGCIALPAEPLEPTSLPPTETIVPTVSPTVPPSPTTPPRKSVYLNIPYVYEGHNSQHLSVYLPDEAIEKPDKKFPTLFLAHYWNGAPNASPLREVFEFVKELGFASVTIDYRDGPNDGGPRKALSDGYCALAWVYANASDYSLDVDHMIAFGNSYGATIVSNLALTDDVSVFRGDCPFEMTMERPFQGVITFGGGSFGVTGPDLAFGTESFAKLWEKTLFAGDWEPVFEASQILIQTPVLEWAKSDLQNEAKELAQLQPVYWVDPGAPPFLILHGDLDRYWVPAESEEFSAVLENLGVQSNYILLPETAHIRWSHDETIWQNPISQFLKDVIGK